ncbi:MAG: histidine phosphatase family protein [Nitriliruptor sp.]|uniref:histidine phosphatase family protein n=1 Tax=Nitriliruptor sp. TaxID=2448056 RepID=UPI0034A07A0C
MRRLILVRHGESIWNAERRIQGQACAGLSARGHAQADAVAVSLAAAYPDAHLVASDLQRTRETVAPLEVALERRAVLDPRLRERSFGDWERRLRDEVAATDPERWQRWLRGEDVVGEVGGESADALADRVAPVLVELLAATPAGGTTIAVTHGGPVWNGIHRLAGIAAGTLGGVDNASCHHLVTFADDGSQVIVDRWNEVGHLPADLHSGWAPSASETGVASSSSAASAAASASAASDGPPGGR